ncbi:MAG TPA: HAD family hydrolase, partial [Sedimentisphaerales bacterium]|nr:HAD family hydrolase [Sedimentisphaerales bacterium]
MSAKAVFLDRDGTLIEDPGYLSNVEMVRLLPGVPDALSHMRRLGYKLVVVSNQSGVARGIIREEVLAQITDRMRRLLGNEGAYLDGVYYCPFHPDGVIERYRKETDDRKPMPGMLFRAAKDLDIDLSQSWAIGDAYRDVEAGWRSGCRTILLNAPPDRKRPGPNDVRPDFEAVNLKEAANIIHHQETIKRETKSRPEAPDDKAAPAAPISVAPAPAANPPEPVQAASQPEHAEDVT